MSGDVGKSRESKIEIDLSNYATFPQDATRLTVLFNAGEKKNEKQAEDFHKKLIQLTGESEELKENITQTWKAINATLVNN